MKNNIECPFCEGMAPLKVESKQISYMQELHLVSSHFYQCEKCLEEFTTTEMDSLTMKRVLGS